MSVKVTNLEALLRNAKRLRELEKEKDDSYRDDVHSYGKEY